MDIRNFFGGAAAAPKTSAPTSTLGELRKKSKGAEKPSKKAATVDDDDTTDSVIVLKESPVKKEKRAKLPERSSPRKHPRPEVTKPKSAKKGKKSKSKPEEEEEIEIKVKPKEKTKEKFFQLLDEDDLDVDGPDDDFVMTKSPKKSSRKRLSSHPRKVEDENSIDRDSDDDAIVRKKAKVIKRRGQVDDEDAPPAKESSRRKKKDAAVRILNSDDEDEDEGEELARKHERRERAAMKKALMPDSHGLRNQEITSAVSAATSHQKKEAPKKQAVEQPVRQVKEISAEDFFGTAPVKHHSEPKKEVESAMEVDDLAVDEQNLKTEKTVKSPSPKKSPKPVEPLTPKTNHDDRKTTTPARTPGKTVSPKDTGDRRKSNYKEFLSREPPKHLGEKELPTGSPTCLEGMSIVLTGILESFERDDLKAALEKMGARVPSSISKKTSYVVLGRDAGPAKVEKAKSMKIPTLDEDGLLELVNAKAGPSKAKSKAAISSPPKVKTPKVEVKASMAKKEVSGEKPTRKLPPSLSQPVTKKESPVKAPSPMVKKEVSVVKPTRNLPPSLSQPVIKKESSIDDEVKSSSQPVNSSTKPQPVGKTSTELWVDKYRPKSLKNIVGQSTEQSCVNKLLRWLRNWMKNIHVKPNMGPFAKNPEGVGLKAALLSGPPGIGKTTSAHLVCKELGVSVVEMNASDTRSKKSLDTWVSAQIQSKSITSTSESVKPNMPDHCLIMDEVDGMAGNEDRGGVAELIGLIKKSKVPIICICNDRSAQKIRSLANYCFDLRFQKPNSAQIKGTMMSMACREGVKIPADVIGNIIEATNSDLRQIVNQLQMYASQSQASLAKYHARKDVRLGTFQLADRILSYEENKHMSIADRMDLFFQDYSLVPLFVQENYTAVWPHRASSMGAGKKSQIKALKLLEKTAESLSIGDMFEKRIRSTNDWSILSGQAVVSCAIPSYLMSGSGRSNLFPAWFGKTSHAGKVSRLIQQIGLHTSLATGVAGKTGFALDYVPALKSSVITPLLKEGEAGVSKVIGVFEYYDLIREDLDALLEADQWPGQPEVWKQVDSKVKSSLTRQYNKSGHMTHYAVTTMTGGAKKRAAANAEENLEELLGEEGSRDQSDSEQDDDDPMVKPTSSKGKGRGGASSARGAAGRGGRGGARGGRGSRGGKK